MKIFKIKNLKGQLFLMSTLLLTIVSVAGLIILSVFNKHLKMSYEIGDSIRALFVADSCIEWQVAKSINKDIILSEPVFGDVSNIIKCSEANKIVGDQKVLYSGTVKNISRSLEVRTR
ncbi:MAG: hypothetical protein AB7D02_00285 [Candidatus Paceibacterota bacterium]